MRYTNNSFTHLLDLVDPMIFIYELHVDILKIHMHTVNEVSRSRLLRVRARTGQTDRQTDTHTNAQMKPNAVLCHNCG